MLPTTEFQQFNPVMEGANPAIREQVQRILLSLPLRHCAVLQSFLVYITEKAVLGKEAEINEHLIARDLFSRTNFDPGTDTIVRTQAYRLRLKLQEYYRTEGKQDPIVIDVPKGHYVPVFRWAGAVSSEPAAPETDGAPDAPKPEVTAPVPQGPREASGWTMHRRIAACALAAGLVALGWISGSLLNANRRQAPAATSRVPGIAPPDSAIEAFWQNFLQGDKEPVLAYTNARFLSTGRGQLLPFSGTVDGDRGAAMDRGAFAKTSGADAQKEQGDVYFENDFTGVGEVTAAVAINNVLSSLGARPSVKRGGLVTAYDLRNHNVIFLGSPFVNRILTELPRPAGFVFLASPTAQLWNSSIQNLHPAAGEPQEYRVERNAGNGVLLTDFGTIDLLPGISPGRRILILAGLTTSGTEAAADAAAGLRGIAEMEKALGVGKNGTKKWPESFQTVWRVQLSRGLDVIDSKLVASRPLQK